MKKFMSAALVLTLCLSFSVSASATSAEHTTVPEHTTVLEFDNRIPKDVMIDLFLQFYGQQQATTFAALRPVICEVTGEPHNFWASQNRGVSVFAHGADAETTCYAARMDYAECNYCKGWERLAPDTDLSHVSFTDECNDFPVPYSANTISFVPKYWDEPLR